MMGDEFADNFVFVDLNLEIRNTMKTILGRRMIQSQTLV
jgi:hypothetical protein